MALHMSSIKEVQEDIYQGRGLNYEVGDSLSFRSYHLGSEANSSKFRESQYTTSISESKITPWRLREIATELGIIRLCWPEITESLRKYYPESYYENNNKEKLLLWYAENFRQQFHYHFPKRRPLLLAADNECGLQEILRNVTKMPNRISRSEKLDTANWRAMKM